MKKKLLSIVALASLMVLGGCGNKESANSTTPKPTETTNKTTEGPKPTETSKPTENLPTEPVVKDAATRHKEYLENYGDKTKSITIQGKVVHAVSYPGKEGAENPNCNIAIQEGKYGYWMNNVPKASIEIGKSYVFTGVGSAKKYPSLNMKDGTITATDDIEATPLILGDAANNFEDSKDAYATIPEGGVVITSADQDAHKYGFMIGEKEFFVSYNASVTQAEALNEKVATLNVGSKVTKLSGTWYAEDTINLCNPNEIEFTPAAVPTATGVTITAVGDATEVQATKTLQLTAVVAPAGANQKVVWSSEKEDVATVSATGIVTGVKAGTTKIFATAEGTEIKGEYSITVTAAPSEPVTPNKALAKYSFANNGSSTTAYDSAALNALFATKVDATTENIVTEITDASKVYPGQSKYEAFGLKLGTGSVQGKFTAKTSKAISKAVITGYGWKATDSVSIGGAADQVFGNVYNAANVTAVTLTFTFTSTTTIPVVFTNRGFITTLEFFA